MSKLNPSINGQVFIEHPLLSKCLQSHIRAGLQEHGSPADQCIFGFRKRSDMVDSEGPFVGKNPAGRVSSQLSQAIKADHCPSSQDWIKILHLHLIVKPLPMFSGHSVGCTPPNPTVVRWGNSLCSGLSWFHLQNVEGGNGWFPGFSEFWNSKFHIRFGKRHSRHYHKANEKFHY